MAKSDCAKFNILISMAVDRELRGEEKEELEAHLETCPECRAYLQMLRSVSSAVRETAVQPPAKLADGIMYKVRHETSRKHMRFLAVGRYTAIAAVFCLVLFAAYKIIPLISKSNINTSSADSVYSAKSADTAVSEEAGYGASKAAADNGSGMDAGIMSDTGGTADDSGENSRLEQNKILPSDGETKSSEGEVPRMAAAAPVPLPTASTASGIGPEYAAQNTRGYTVYKGLKYEESFYSVCIIYGGAPEEIKDCEKLYSGDGQTHYKVPQETMTKLTEKFDEIYLGDLKADFALVITIEGGK